jgi:non-heme chloroperoxidase
MSYIAVGTENKYNLELHFTDRGAGEPVVLIHGYPFNGAALEKQEEALIAGGYRVITYDRRGFGESSKPSIGYDYDTFAADLHTIIETLDLKSVTLIGHSMGTGEIARYIGRYGSENIFRAVMISPIPPFLLKTSDNQGGVDEKVFDEIKAAIKKDRCAYMSEFLKSFYNSIPESKDGMWLVSEDKMVADFNLGVTAGNAAFYKCVDAWLTDFRQDIVKIDIPLLVIQGDDDRILPIDVTGRALTKTVGKLVVIAKGPHGIPWTHAEQVNTAILEFLDANRKVTLVKDEGGDAAQVNFH